jgi:hypothetical protein
MVGHGAGCACAGQAAESALRTDDDPFYKTASGKERCAWVKTFTVARLTFWVLTLDAKRPELRHTRAVQVTG